MPSSINPFIENVEGSPTRPPPKRFYKTWFGATCTVIVGVLGFLAFIYVMATLDPLGFGGKDSGNETLHNVDHEPYDVQRPIRRRPAELNNDTRLTVRSNLTLDDSSSRTEMVKSTTELSSHPYEFKWSEHRRIDAQLLALKYPEIPPANLCIPLKMDMTEFLDKQWYCYRCWQDAVKHTYNTTWKMASEKEHRFYCHANCYKNLDFHRCALHLYKTQADSYVPSASARQCRFCNVYLLADLKRGYRTSDEY